MSAPTPQPSADTRSCSSLFDSTFCSDACSVFSTLPRSGRIACVLRSRPCLAEPPAESPSTMNSSLLAGIGRRAVGQLAGQVQPVRHRGLARHRLRRRARRLARLRRQRDALDDLRARGPVLEQEASRAPGRTAPSTCACASGLPSRSLVWPWNCGSCMYIDRMPTTPSRMSSAVSVTPLGARFSWLDERAHRLDDRRRGTPARASRPGWSGCRSRTSGSSPRATRSTASSPRCGSPSRRRARSRRPAARSAACRAR